MPVIAVKFHGELVVLRQSYGEWKHPRLLELMPELQDRLLSPQNKSAYQLILMSSSQQEPATKSRKQWLATIAYTEQQDLCHHTMYRCALMICHLSYHK